MTRKNQLRLVASLAVAVVGAVVIELTADIEPAVSLVLTVTFIAVSLALVPRERPPWLEIHHRHQKVTGIVLAVVGAVALIVAERRFTEEGEYLSPL